MKIQKSSQKSGTIHTCKYLNEKQSGFIVFYSYKIVLKHFLPILIQAYGKNLQGGNSILAFFFKLEPPTKRVSASWNSTVECAVGSYVSWAPTTIYVIIQENRRQQNLLPYWVHLGIKMSLDFQAMTGIGWI